MRIQQSIRVSTEKGNPVILFPLATVRLMRTLTAVAAATLILLAGGTAAAAARPSTRPSNGLAIGHLVRQHDCIRYDQPMPGPIAGYLVRDTAKPSKGLFYKDSGSFTAGMVVERGGTLKLEWQCRR